MIFKKDSSKDSPASKIDTKGVKTKISISNIINQPDNLDDLPNKTNTANNDDLAVDKKGIFETVKAKFNLTKNDTIATEDSSISSELSIFTQPTAEPILTESSEPTNLFQKVANTVSNYRESKITDELDTLPTTTLDDQAGKIVIANTINNSLPSTYVAPKKTVTQVVKKGIQSLFDPLHIISYLIAATACVLFIYTSLSENIAAWRIPDARLERVYFISLGIMVVLDMILVFFITRNFFKGLYIFLALFTLQFSAFIYALKVFGSTVFVYNSIAVTTDIVVLILPLIIFMQCLGIIQNKNRLWVNIAQAILIFSQFFSIIPFLTDSSKQFNNPVYTAIFQFPALVWTIFASLAIAILTSYGMKRKVRNFTFTFLTILPLLNIIMLTKTTTYWYQTILALIVWDLIYTPLLESDTENTDSRVIPKLFVSTVYHSFLLILLMAISTYFNIFTRN